MREDDKRERGDVRARLNFEPSEKVAVPKVHTFTIQNRPDAPYLTYIKNGEKTAECRVDSLGYKKLQVGDQVHLHNYKQGILCDIVFLNRYKTFEDMVKTEGATNLLPQLKIRKLSPDKLIEAAVNVYKGFPGSQRVTICGCLAIGVKYVSDKNHD